MRNFSDGDGMLIWHTHMECFQRGIYKREEVGAMREQVETALEQIRPMLQQDGGDVELVDVDGNGLVRVRLKGACSG
jgi:hypothetical protein